MDLSHELFEFFLENSFIQNPETLPYGIIEKINQLNRTEKANLKALLFNEAKKMTIHRDAHLIIMWLENCFSTIEKYSFRFHQVFFSPGDEIPKTILGLVNDAKQSVALCIFTLSHHELAKALKNASIRGIQIRIITDDEKQYDKGSQIHSLKDSGISVKMDNSRYLMHHKFGVIDNRLAFTGSFNWTYTATKHNQENLLITSNFDIVHQYREEFERLWLLMK